MRLRRLAASAALLSVAISPGVARAGTCWYPNEAKAAQVRALHLMLMVGTLQCRRRDPAATESFTAFVRNQDRLLVANNEVLKGRFMRESGVDRWQADLDRFSTSLANLYSGRLDDGGYCRMMVRTAWDAADANGAQLARMADAFSDAPVGGACEVRMHAGRVGPPKIAISDALRSAPPPIPPIVEPAVEVVAPEAPVTVLAEVEPAPEPDAEPLVAVAEADAIAAEAEVIAAAAGPEPEPVVEADVALASVAPAEATAPAATTLCARRSSPCSPRWSRFKRSARRTRKAEPSPPRTQGGEGSPTTQPEAAR